jgi:hypothetical protein
MRIFETLRNIENDFPLLITGTGNDRSNRSGANFYNSKAVKQRDEEKE